MLWRIGEILEFDQQLKWTLDAGFGGVGFHASAGTPGKWCGVDPSACGALERERLRREITRFAFAEIHAPFAIELRNENLAVSAAALMPVLELANDVGVGLVTIHATLPRTEPDLAAWVAAMQELDVLAAQMGIRIALEIADGFDLVKDWGLPNVGVTLDVGHMYLAANRNVLIQNGGIGGLIHRIGTSLYHLHLHDVAGETDHIEIGTGRVAFDEIALALHDISYPYGVMLEMNPDRVTPDGIQRSADFIDRCVHFP
jgi:sugar phosphate isomerase/epimerase